MTKRFVKGLAVLALGALVAAGCGRQRDGTGAAAIAVKNDQRWSQYVSEHSSGLISRNAQITIRFAVDAIAEGQVGTPQTGLVTLAPSASISAVFNNPRELVLVPKDPLESGRSYVATLKAGVLKALPNALGDFQFVVHVLPQGAEVQLEGLDLDPDKAEHMLLRGLVVTADVADADAVERMVTAKVDADGLALSWQHDSEGRYHRFASASFPRLETARKVTVAWDQTAIGGQGKGDREIEVPARGVFGVTQIERSLGTETWIEVDFSEALDKRQNLNGLVDLSSGEFTTRIDGNSLRIFPAEPPNGQVTVTIGQAIRSADGRRMKSDVSRTITFETQKPEVRFVGNGSILPQNDALTIPFEAVNVASVQVTAFRVYESNIGQFLQVNKLDGGRELNRVGRFLWRRTIPLGPGPLNEWRRLAFDASDLFRSDPQGLFRLTISIDRSNSLYQCSDADRAVPVPAERPLSNGDEYGETDSSGWDYADDYYESYEQRRRDRDDPCKDEYYRHTSGANQSRNFVSANVGMIAKVGTDDRIHLVTTDVRTGAPLGGTRVTLFSFQNQPIVDGTTDGNGMLVLAPEIRPFYARADRGDQRGYLKLSQGLALSTSHFDVGGVKVERGIKGTIYGERGVWRPGDTMHLTFVLQDPENAVPAGHPATLELINPRGQSVHSQTVTEPVGDFYPFHLSTAEQDLTGSWRAIVKLGGRSFERSVKVETVMPNRLKVELDIGGESLRLDQTPKLDLFGQWLHGASAGGLKADVKVRLKPLATRFKRAADFAFDDPTRSFAADEQTLFEGTLDATGHARFAADLIAERGAAGRLNAEFTSRVFEPGGAFSTAVQSAEFNPYLAYVGIKLPKGDVSRSMLLTDTRHPIELVTFDPSGEPVDVAAIEVTVHKLAWRWWWDQAAESFASFESSTTRQLVSQETVATKGGKGQATLEIKYPDWGRYLVRACAEDGHCTGRVIYIDWPGWAGRAQEQQGPGANALTLYADKAQYAVGETAVVHLPPKSVGRALISIEDGSGILEQRWLELDGERDSFEVTATPAMAPNAYVSVTLLQPHHGKANDRPIRLYGVLPLAVSDPQTRLEPRVEVADQVRPEAEFSIAVSEAKGRAMTYTVQIVDEGLLGLTAFKTPDLHSEFYRREALGVRTWDMFDEVVGAYGGQLERLLALGGSDGGPLADKNKERKRFPPVVKVLGPFRLAAGESASHQVRLPPYVGAVRVMVVAGEAAAYGNAERTVLVKQPVMLQATLPRVIGPGEELRVPISVFVLDDAVREVEVATVVDEHFSVVGDAKVKLRFERVSDQLGFVRLKVAERLGKARVRFTASAGKERAEQAIDIEVRPANPATTVAQRTVIEPGKGWSVEFKAHGIPGTNETTLEVSSVPAVNLSERLQYLVRFPHGCVEQTTSAAFPQLYLDRLLPLEEAEQKRIQGNVSAAIDRLRMFQQADGAFGYWPGANDYDSWSTTYAGHFLVEAQRTGYAVPANMVASWRGFQRARAQSFVADEPGTMLDQAYRLYVLALAGSPELGAMNRLREKDKLPNHARWLLAAAYKRAGLGDVAIQLARGGDLSVARYEFEGLTFGAPLRDRGMLLESLVVLGDQLKAKDLAEAISEELSSSGWYSTHAVSWALLALGHFVGDAATNQSFAFQYALGGGAAQAVSSSKPVKQVTLQGVGEKPLRVQLTNQSALRLYASLSNRGVAPVGSETASAESLQMSVQFRDEQGRSLTVDQLVQGKDFRAWVRVRNESERDLTNLALTQIVPPGWEVTTVRGAVEGESSYDYRDYRDDRVHTYFALRAGAQKEFELRFTAAYPGRYYLPSWSVEAMYDARRHARNAGRWVTVETEAPRGE